MRQPLAILGLRALTPLALAALSTAQTTWHVDVNATPPGNGTAGSPYASLQFCIAQPATADGDTVLVAPGTYVEDLDLLGKSLELRSSAGATQTHLRPLTTTSVLVVENVANAQLEGFTVRDGRGTLIGSYTRGGGILCVGSTLAIVDCVLRDNRATYGGNLCVQSGSVLSLLDCQSSAGQAALGGGMHVEDSAVLAVQTSFTSNRGGIGGPVPQYRGLGIHAVLGAELTLQSCDVTDNRPAQTTDITFLGAGIYVDQATGLLTDCLVANNGNLGIVSTTQGGGLWVSSTSFQLERCTIRANRALHEGGGIYGNAQLTDCDIESNVATAGGGGAGPLTLIDCRLVDNSYTHEGSCSKPGGGVSGWGQSTLLVRCLLQGNRSRAKGGGAYFATLVECELIDNRVDLGFACSSAQGGGGLWGGSATDCVFRGNRVVGGPTSMSAAGGGAAAEASLVRCTLEDNEVDMTAESSSTTFMRVGGGAWDCQLEDCVVADNRVKAWRGQSAQGGGIRGGSALRSVVRGNSVQALDPTYPFAMGGGAALATLTLCTLYGNEADHGGGAWKASLARCTVEGNSAALGGGLSLHPGGTGSAGNASVSDSILWNNAGGEIELDAGTLAVTYSDVLGDWPGTGNIADDPRFWNAAAGDHHLRPDSPCIDSGDPNAPLDPDGSRRDMGALPFDDSYAGGPYLYCTAKETAHGCLPAIGFSGAPTLSGLDDFVVGATPVTGNQSGMLFWGDAAASVPFLGGTRCVANPVVRTPPSHAGGTPGGCTGSLSFHVSHAFLGSQGLIPGDRVFAQFWFRDPTHPDGTGIGLSDAIDFTVLP